MKAITRVCLQLTLLSLIAIAGIWSGPRLRGLYERAFPAPAYVSGDYGALYAETSRRVVLFSSSTCPHCRRAREFLDAQHVEYADLVIDKSDEAQRRFEKLGEVGVPVLFIGDRKIVGFREDVVAEALKQGKG